MTDEIKNILLALSDRPIAFQRSYVRITKSITSGLLLSQIMYWCGVQKSNTFYKTNEEFCDETGMTAEEMKNAKKKLQDLGFITVALRGQPARSVYEVDLEKIVLTLHQLDGAKATNKMGQIAPTIYTETTTETTTKKVTPNGVTKEKPAGKPIPVMTEEELAFQEKFMAEFNGACQTAFKKIPPDCVNNVRYWRSTYTDEQLFQAVKEIPHDTFWRDKMSPAIFFRRGNPDKEPVDYIGRFLAVRRPPPMTWSEESDLVADLIQISEGVPMRHPEVYKKYKDFPEIIDRIKKREGLA